MYKNKLLRSIIKLKNSVNQNKLDIGIRINRICSCILFRIKYNFKLFKYLNNIIKGIDNSKKSKK